MYSQHYMMNSSAMSQAYATNLPQHNSLNRENIQFQNPNIQHIHHHPQHSQQQYGSIQQNQNLQQHMAQQYLQRSNNSSFFNSNNISQVYSNSGLSQKPPNEQQIYYDRTMNMQNQQIHQRQLNPKPHINTPSKS